MKAFIAFVVLLLLVLGGVGGYLFLGKMNRIEPRGVGLTLSNPIPSEEIEFQKQRYNEILDRDEVLLNTVTKHGLKDYYGVASDEKALELFRDDSFIELPGGKNLHVLFRGKRSTRKERESATRTLAEDFVKAAQLMGK
ncbi:hypothetical protein AAFN60_08370 [Roseibacillus persicicus]|uniref:hypothetical protein n=1 Tax=Roseibacillus persicicus TaxID=454148 RepID=UPI00398BA54F